MRLKRVYRRIPLMIAQIIGKSSVMKYNVLLKSFLLLFVVTLFSCTPESTTPDSKVVVTGVTLNKSTLSLKVGNKETLVGTIAPINATEKGLIWSSDNTTVATVSGVGEVTALAVGTSTVTVKTTDGNKTATSTVTVKLASLDKKISENKESNTIVARYVVDGENIKASSKFEASNENLVHQKKVALHQRIWNELKKVISPNYRHFISSFEVLHKGDSSGHASPENSDLSKWVIALTMDSQNVTDIQYVAIHEFGHVLSLNNTQLDPSISDEKSCPNFNLPEGCSKKRSYINQIYSRFWADIWEEYQSSKSSQAAKIFYTKYKDRFVTEYASSDLGEDLAETIAEFVYVSKPPSNSTKISDKKILLLYEYPELVEWRNYVKKSISPDYSSEE